RANGSAGSRGSLVKDGARRATAAESSGQHTPSKALPIKELLAPAAEKVKHRASIVATAAAAASGPVSPGLDGRRRGSQPAVEGGTEPIA
ncbi:hypothetical protein H4S02_009647, partial [Coemansia sp. RSA 2611]